jgi:hypothetical protein
MELQNTFLRFRRSYVAFASGGSCRGRGFNLESESYMKKENEENKERDREQRAGLRKNEKNNK